MSDIAIDTAATPEPPPPNRPLSFSRLLREASGFGRARVARRRGPVSALFAAKIAPYDPLDQDLLGVKQWPSHEHWLGTDALGRDVLSMLIYGGAPTLIGVVQAVVVAGGIGIGLGVTSGYYGGRFDAVVNQIVDLVLSLPTIVVLLAVLAVFHHNMLAAMVTVGLLGSASMTRVIRSVALGVRHELYIEAARIGGLSDAAIMTRHVIPRILGPVLVQISLFAAVTVLIETGISFLGLGVPPPDPSWGNMIADASVNVNDFPWLLVPSGGAAALTILAFGLLGDFPHATPLRRAGRVLGVGAETRESRRDGD